MDLRERLMQGNRLYTETVDKTLLQDLAVNGQRPYAIVICCSDSRVVPERIFSADLGDLFVIRVAGNVLDNHQLGSVEYAAAHLHCGLVVLLGHTRSSRRSGGRAGGIRFIYNRRYRQSRRSPAGSLSGCLRKRAVRSGENPPGVCLPPGTGLRGGKRRYVRRGYRSGGVAV